MVYGGSVVKHFHRLQELDSEKNLREHYARPVDSSEHTCDTFISALLAEELIMIP
jgi:hypothetical protein